jgi:hypothetical protein
MKRLFDVIASVEITFSDQPEQGRNHTGPSLPTSPKYPFKSWLDMRWRRVRPHPALEKHGKGSVDHQPHQGIAELLQVCEGQSRLLERLQLGQIFLPLHQPGEVIFG